MLTVMALEQIAKKEPRVAVQRPFERAQRVGGFTLGKPSGAVECQGGCVIGTLPENCLDEGRRVVGLVVGEQTLHLIELLSNAIGK